MVKYLLSKLSKSDINFPQLYGAKTVLDSNLTIYTVGHYTDEFITKNFEACKKVFSPGFIFEYPRIMLLSNIVMSLIIYLWVGILENIFNSQEVIQFCFIGDKVISWEINVFI